MYVVYFVMPELGPQLVSAARFRVEGEHLVFLTEEGKLAALFLLEIVMDWVQVVEESV